MTNQSFKSIAVKLLTESGKPLHYREITRLATEQGLLQTEGKTPWATMNAQLSMDIINNGESSIFYRAQPGYFGLKAQGIVKQAEISGKARIVKHTVTDSLNTKQKGDIAEARVAELLTLYGDEGLICAYRSAVTTIKLIATIEA